MSLQLRLHLALLVPLSETQRVRAVDKRSNRISNLLREMSETWGEKGKTGKRTQKEEEERGNISRYLPSGFAEPLGRLHTRLDVAKNVCT
jgi:hypothetical protein